VCDGAGGGRPHKTFSLLSEAEDKRLTPAQARCVDSARSLDVRLTYFGTKCCSEVARLCFKTVGFTFAP